MNVLAIDTILHDACVAVIKGRKVLSNIKKSIRMRDVSTTLLSLTEKHTVEIAKLIHEALISANIVPKDINLIVVNNRGSLLSSVLTGVVAANVFAELYDIPIVSVEHEEGHVFSKWIEEAPEKMAFPALVFSSSGAHILLAYVTDAQCRYETIFHSAGIGKKHPHGPEYKGIGYLFSELIIGLQLQHAQERKRGDGPLIENIAQKGNIHAFSIGSPTITHETNLDKELRKMVKGMTRFYKKNMRSKKYSKESLCADIAASFQHALAYYIASYACAWAKQYQARSVHFVGGIAANRAICKYMKTIVEEEHGLVFYYLHNKDYCTDNAVMIACTGYYKFMQNPERYKQQRSVGVVSDLVLEEIGIEQYRRKNKRMGI